MMAKFFKPTSVPPETIVLVVLNYVSSTRCAITFERFHFIKSYSPSLDASTCYIKKKSQNDDEGHRNGSVLFCAVKTLMLR